MTWKPDKYIIEGEFCNSHYIREELASLRKSFKASSGVLLVFEGDIAFSSLLLISERDKHSEDLHQAELTKEQIPDGIRFGGGWSETVTHSMYLNWLRRSKPRLYEDLILPATSVKVLQQRIRTAKRQRDRKTIFFGLAVLLINPTARPQKSLVQKRIRNLFCMVSASVPVLVNRDLTAVKNADEVIDRFEANNKEIAGISKLSGEGSIVTDISFEPFAQELLQAALDLTGSSVGNIFLATSNRAMLRLVAQVPKVNLHTELDSGSISSIVTWVYRRQRPLLINDIETFQDSHPGIAYLPMTGHATGAYAELAVPIRQRSFGSLHYSVLGVINVEKVINVDNGYFTYRDLAALRDLALRFCLWRTNTLFSVSAEALARFTRRNIASSGQGSRSSVESPSTAMPTGVPADAWQAKKEVSDSVEQSYKLTRSASATVRLLSTDCRYLVRFCAFPESAMSDPYPSIPVKDQRSVHAWVAGKGVECYIPDLGAVSHRKKYPGLMGVIRARENVTSELCAPIFVSGRLVGTINLESEYKDAYAETRYLVRAIAQQIGLTLSHERRALEEIVLSLSASSTLNMHELLKCMDRINAVSHTLPLESKQEIIEVCERMYACVHASAKQASPPPPQSTREVIREVIDYQGYGSQVKWNSEQGPASLDTLLAGNTASLLRLAFTEILRNVYSEAMRSRQFLVRVSANERPQGGGRFLAIWLTNQVQSVLPIVLAERLYRLPIVTDRYHIGSFLAGSMMRAIGGDVYLAENSGTKIRTVIEIPL